MFVLSKQLLKMRAGQEEGHHRRRAQPNFSFLLRPPYPPSGRLTFWACSPFALWGTTGGRMSFLPSLLISIPRESKRKARKHLMGTESHKSKRSHVELHPYYYSLLFSLCDEKRKISFAPHITGFFCMTCSTQQSATAFYPRSLKRKSREQTRLPPPSSSSRQL